jgi:hypothetical protein
MEQPPNFVAYVYPGWHSTPYRPGVNEWDLLSRFEPAFDGHPHPPAPLFGCYDDSVSDTARDQIALASRAGITGFIYFTYFSEASFVMNSPLQRAIEESPHIHPAFYVSASWCVRLPHRLFPVTSEDRYAIAHTDQPEKADFLDRPIEDTTLDNISELFEGSTVWRTLQIALDIGTPHTQTARARQGALSLEELTSIITVVKIVQSGHLTLHSIRSVMAIRQLSRLSLEQIAALLTTLASWYACGSTTVIALEQWLRKHLSRY